MYKIEQADKQIAFITINVLKKRNNWNNNTTHETYMICVQDMYKY